MTGYEVTMPVLTGRIPIAASAVSDVREERAEVLLENRKEAVSCSLL
jgi:hypothetical protein